jgi:hypothetical protein
MTVGAGGEEQERGAGRRRRAARCGRHRSSSLAPAPRHGGALVVALLLALALPCAPAAALTISPLNGTPDASPQTQISFLDVSPGELSDIRVSGSHSGHHSGRLLPYRSGPGASFVPSHPFAAGEWVKVTAVVAVSGRRRQVSTSFAVARPAAWTEPPLPSGGHSPTPTGAIEGFHSVPALRPPAVHVLFASPAASADDIFLAPAHGPGQHGPMIVGGDGRLVWFQPAPPGTVAMDFQVEHYEGRPVLAWWQGRILGLGVGLGVDEIYSTSYQPLARVAAGNGYQADLHELRITPEGSAFLTAYAPVHADVSGGGGSSRGTVLDSIVQEVDIKTGLVMFEWHALSRVPVWDSYTHPGAADEPWDYFHVNSISLDPWGDGNFVISSRNTWAAYEVSKHTGAIMWRIGGKRPTFHMGAGTGMAWQHDVRWQPDHTLTIFDDGALPKVHSQSRVIRERIDWRRRSVSLVGRYTHSPAILAGSQGNAQVLPGGGSFVGWGEAPYLTEFGSGGQIVYDAKLPPAVQSYRAYRFAWSGQPATQPALALAPSGAGTLTAYASWNGATAVRAWRVLGGSGPGAMQPLATSPSTGFETALAVPGGQAAYAVAALDDAGRVLAESPVAHP